MTENDILNELAEVLIQTIKKNTNNVSASEIIKIAHLNGSILNPDKMFRHQSNSWLRLVFNGASDMDWEIFSNMMMIFTKKIWEYANDTDILDLINNNHNFKQQNK